MNASLKQTAKKLSDVLGEDYPIEEELDPDISGLRLDSRQVKKGDLFLAFPGALTDGRQYIDQAIKQGAVAVLYEEKNHFTHVNLKNYDSAVAVYPVENLADKAGKYAAAFYENPSSAVTVIGITGTNGKTSCSHMIAQALKNSGNAAGVIGTLGSGCWGKLSENKNTTPDALSLQQQIAEMKGQGVEYVAMEVSSHGLEQGRVKEVLFDTALLTNISRDHLDYHHTMDEYIKAKEQLFYSPGIKRAIINSDDPLAYNVAKAVSARSKFPVCQVGYCIDASEGLKINSATVEHDGLEIDFSSQWGSGHLKNKNLHGDFNVSNLMMTLATLLSLGLSVEQAEVAVSQVEGVPGRMEKVGEGTDGALIFVDYAHTPDALRSALISAKRYCKNKLICVFGCGGDRDQGKRAEMGEVASALAQQIVITADNPRSESVQVIGEQIISGMNSRKAGRVIVDRRKAIIYAMEHAGRGDVVLIAGKGVETYQEAEGVRHPFSDHQVVREVLSGRVG